MIYVLTTCTIVLGKRAEFETTFRRLQEVYEKHGAKLVGFWWTIGGENNEVCWIMSWKDLNSYEKEIDEAMNENDFPIEGLSSTVITQSDRIMKASSFSPLK